jgi:hypothetical protein
MSAAALAELLTRIETLDREWQLVCDYRENVFSSQDENIRSTGAPGRPSSMHLIRAEFQARIDRGETKKTISLESQALSKWLSIAHPKAPPTKWRTIKNQLAADFRKRLLSAQN